MRRVIVPAVLILALVVAGCGKAPAQAALKAADEAIAKIQPEAEKYVPEEFKTLTTAAADAKAKFDAGNYTEALAAAKDLPAKANDVMAAASKKKDELTKTWTDAQASLPAMVQGLTDRVGSLGAMKKLPKEFDAAKLASAKTTLADITSSWSAASEAFKNGALTDAVSKVESVKTMIDDLTKALPPVEVAKK